MATRRNEPRYRKLFELVAVKHVGWLRGHRRPRLQRRLVAVQLRADREQNRRLRLHRIRIIERGKSRGAAWRILWCFFHGVTSLWLEGRIAAIPASASQKLKSRRRLRRRPL